MAAATRRAAARSLELVSRGDAALGRQFERLVIAHHARRLGHGRACAGWRLGLGGAASAAGQQCRCLRGWAVTLAEIAFAETPARVEVRLLAWAGAPLLVFRPDRDHLRAVGGALSEGTRVRVALDARERPLHCQHESS